MEVISSAHFVKSSLIFFRIFPILFFLPGANYIPIKIKLLFSIAFAVLLSFIIQYDWPEVRIINYLYEGLIGSAVGLYFNILFHALTTAGTFLGLQSGLTQATFFNPTIMEQNNILANFLLILVITLLFVTDTHTIIIIGIAESYSTISHNIVTIKDIAALIVDAVGTSFELGFKISLPVVFICTLTYFIGGLIGKLIPYLQVFFILAPLQIFIAMIIIYLILAGIVVFFMDHYNSLLMDLYQS